MTKEEYYPAEEQGILKKKNKEKKEDAMKEGEIDTDVYSETGRHILEENDEIEPWEEGFMEGADSAGQLGKDALTGEPLMDIEEVYEEEINGKIYRFVNRENAEKFKKEKEDQEE